MAKVTEHIYLENLDGRAIRFANFKGVERPPYNARGQRNFSVDILDDEFANKLAKDGWNIKPAVDKETPEGEIIHYPAHLKVNIKYNPERNLGPKVMMEQAGNKVYLDESSIGDLDDMEIIEVKAIEIRPYNWDVNGTTGVTAYLDKMRVEVARDIFCD